MRELDENSRGKTDIIMKKKYKNYLSKSSSKRFGFTSILILLTSIFTVFFTACERNDMYSFAKNEKEKTYYAAGLNGTLFKTDDITSGIWENLTNTTLPFSSIISVSSKLVVSGGSYPPSNSGFIKSSNDGSIWIDNITPGSAYFLRGLLAAPSLFLAYGDDSGAKQVWFSSDGFNWTQSAAIPNGTYNATFNLQGAAYGNGYYIIAGGFNTNGEIIRSSNGSAWTVVSPSCQYLNGAAYSPAYNRFVAVGRVASLGTIIYSNDSGTTWIDTSIGSFDHNSVAYGNGIFVAVGASGQIYSSADGITWTAQSSGTSAALLKVFFLKDRFFALGTSGTIISSTNAIQWINISPGGVNSLNSITFI